MPENTPNHPELASSVFALMAELRRRIRQYVWLEGLTSAAAWLGIAFWLTLVIDWFFEPPAAFRVLMLLGVGIVLLVVLVQLIGRRAFVKMTDDNMAMLLERRFSKIDDSLLTAVELLRRNRSADHECDQQLLAETCEEAAQRTADLQLGEVFNPLPLRSILAAALLTISVIVFSAVATNALATWTSRVILMEDELWPRRTDLSIVGFEDGVAKVARGADFKIVARANTAAESVPDIVDVRYRTDAGRARRDTMSRLEEVETDEGKFREYSYTFQSVLTSISFDVVGGDDRVGDLRIEVVDSPTIEMVLECVYPEYMDRSERELPVAGVMQLPLGTEIAVVCKANKELVGAKVESHKASADPDQPGEVKTIERTDMESDGKTFRYKIDSLDEDMALLFALEDADGIKSREPVRLALATLPDVAPELTARLDGIGPAITPEARLPAAGTITDDCGIAKAWWEYAVDERKAETKTIVEPDGNLVDIPLDTALEVEGVGVEPGQKLALCVKASDRYDLAEQPNVGTSERWLLEVVTPDQLRARLESRELVLRQRFEAIVREVEETRDTLVKLDFATDEPKPDDDAGAEPDDEEDVASAERKLAVRTVRVQQAIQNCKKNAHETISVAEAFENIRGQLINNRIDTPELNRRLQNEIADPLRDIAEDKLVELQKRLTRLSEVLDDDRTGDERREFAKEQADEVLRAMRRVLDRMLELEDFNEQIELLREIIKMQEEVDEQVKKRHEQSIGDLED